MNKSKRNIYLMYLIVFFQGFVFYGPIATLYRQANGLSMSDIFIIESFFWLFIIIFEVPLGWLADRAVYKRILVLSNVLFFISKVVFYEADTFSLFLLERVLLAMALSGISGCDIAILHNSTRKGLKKFLVVIQHLPHQVILWQPLCPVIF